MNLTIGTRGSKLAIAQAREVAGLLAAAGAEVELRPILTSGDLSSSPLAEEGGKGAFVKEIDEALLKGKVDLAVHSVKDLPASLPRGISLAAIPERRDARDALVLAKGFRTLDDLPKGSRVGTSSPRRKAQLLQMRPDLVILPIRGNVETRLAKLEKGEVEGLLLAAAGLERIHLDDVIAEILPVERMVPAVGQGALGVAARDDDEELRNFLSRACHDDGSGRAVQAERSFLQTVGGDCRTPLAAHAWITHEGLAMIAFMASPDGRRSAVERGSAPLEGAMDLGARLGRRLIDRLRGRSGGEA